MKYTVHDRILKRELGNRTRYSGIRGIYGDRQWVKDLDIVNELEGHNGCVNALSWSKSGKLLASGSDDQHVNVHTYQSDADASQFSLATTISTGHSANIFSVKFMPHSNDRTIISAAGDAEIRIFDIEYAGRTGISSAPTSVRAQGFINNGVQYLSEGDTNCRVYRSHSDRVKRIVTESSPYLFLSCSEDGEVRQWDLRQPSSAYPRPAGSGRWRSREEPTGQVPPPLISYRKWHIDLNTISCSGSQPHYIALGGAHLHCFLHDRRMLGRDVTLERGGTPSSSGYSDHDEEMMGEATQCVKRFAPNGQNKMKGTDTGHITACKISDANPNEMVVSWSGDWIYNFDLLRSPDAREFGEVKGEEERRKSNKLRQARDRKRKRVVKAESPVAQEGSVRGSSRPRTADGNDEGDISLRVRYQNGQSEDIPLREGPESSGPSRATVKVPEASVKSFGIATASVKVRKAMFDLSESGAESDSAEQVKRFSRVLQIVDPVLDEMDNIIKSWRYAVNPDGFEVAFQNTLRRNRESARRFVQASGVLARLLGGDLPLERQSQVFRFAQIRPAPNEFDISEQSEHFSYDFLKAIVLWLTSGPGALVDGFSRHARRSLPHARFPLPEDSSIEAIDEILIPYLLELAGDVPIYNLEASPFELDDRRQVFKSERDAVQAFARVIKIPFEDVASGSSSSQNEVEIEQKRLLSRTTAMKFWGFKVGRSLLLKAGEGVDHAFIDRAFGGLGKADARIRRQERALRSRFENIDPEEEDPVVESVAVGNDEDDDDMDEEDEEMIPVEDLRNIITEAAHEEFSDDEDSDEDIDLGGDTDADVEMLEDEGEDELDDDDDLDDDENDENDEDDDALDDTDDEDNEDAPNTDVLWHSAAERSALRSQVHRHASCATHTRFYRGHCNVKTVKDVNFYGLNDEYVVSGSDSGHIFIWDRASGELINILEGDSEVVNVIQGHPYEPILAASGIDNTVKIFSADKMARRNARMGIGRANTSSFGSQPSAFGRPRRRLARNPMIYTGAPRPLTPDPETAPSNRAQDVDSDDTDTEPPHAVNGLSSRKRMQNEYEITSRNDHDRRGGNSEAFLTRGMLAQLAAHMRARRGGGVEGERGEGGEGENGPPILMMENGQVVVSTDNCGVM